MKRIGFLFTLTCLIGGLAGIKPIEAQSLSLNPCTGQPFHTIADGRAIAESSVSVTQDNASYRVNFRLAVNAEARAYHVFSNDHVGAPLAIVLDSEVIVVPIVQSVLSDAISITVDDYTQAMIIAATLKYGALPIRGVLATRTQTGRGWDIALAMPQGTNPEQIANLKYILQRRLGAFGLALADITLKSDQIIVSIEGDRADVDTIAASLARNSQIEFVDFTQPTTCTASMPGIGDRIQTDTEF
jgi:preprotein translocase subunit SecD